MEFTYGETVTRLRGTLVVDPYSGEANGVDWTTPASLAIPGCAFNPGQTAEPVQDARTAVITQPEVYDPSYADVLPGDRLVVRGKTYEVDGDVQDWGNPFTGWRPAQLIKLKRVAG